MTLPDGAFGDSDKVWVVCVAATVLQNEHVVCMFPHTLSWSCVVGWAESDIDYHASGIASEAWCPQLPDVRHDVQTQL